MVTGGSGNNFTIDDVNFEGAVNVGETTPIPLATLPLFASGLGALGLLAPAQKAKAKRLTDFVVAD